MLSCFGIEIKFCNKFLWYLKYYSLVCIHNNCEFIINLRTIVILQSFYYTWLYLSLFIIYCRLNGICKTTRLDLIKFWVEWNILFLFNRNLLSVVMWELHWMFVLVWEFFEIITDRTDKFCWKIIPCILIWSFVVISIYSWRTMRSTAPES